MVFPQTNLTALSDIELNSFPIINTNLKNNKRLWTVIPKADNKYTCKIKLIIKLNQSRCMNKSRLMIILGESNVLNAHNNSIISMAVLLSKKCSFVHSAPNNMRPNPLKK